MSRKSKDNEVLHGLGVQKTFKRKESGQNNNERYMCDGMNHLAEGQRVDCQWRRRTVT